MKQKVPKTRSAEALQAWNRNGAGQHKDKRKDDNKYKCRTKVDKEDP